MSDKSWEKLSTNHQHYTGTGIMLQQKKDQKPLSWFCKAGSNWRPAGEVVSPSTVTSEGYEVNGWLIIPKSSTDFCKMVKVLGENEIWYL